MQIRIYRKFIVILIVVALIIGSNYAFDGWLQDGVYRVVAVPSLWLRAGVLAVSDFVGGVAHVADLVQEHKLLRREIGTLRGLESSIQEIERENTRLRAQLSVQRSPATLVSARIIDTQQTTHTAALIIDVGADQLIAQGMSVIAPGNILVGVVDEVYRKSARVILIDDPRFVASVRIQDSDVIAKAMGNLDRTFKVDLVTTQEEVEKAQVIVTSGLDSVPPGLLVGEVHLVDNGDELLFQKILGSRLFELYMGPEVFVIRSE